MAGIPNNQATIRERREKLWTLLTKGMKRYEIAKELNVLVVRLHILLIQTYFFSGTILLYHVFKNRDKFQL